MQIPTQSFPSSAENVPPCLLDLKSQRDNVHGFVHLNDVEREVLDTPEMQRLHHIRQLGFAYLIYGTAEHSRFVHSVGVCHTAKLLVDCINKNHRIANEKQIACGRAPSEVERLRSPQVWWAQRVCIGLAGLLHDLPHPPMSHALEHESSVMVKHDDLERNPQLYLYLFGKESTLASVLRRHSPTFVRHALTIGKSLNFTERDLEKFLLANHLERDEALAAFIFEILAFQSPEKHFGGSFSYRKSWGGDTGAHKFFFSRFFRPFYADIISNTICADLIDYLHRDSLNTGIDSGVDLKFLDRMYIKRQAAAGQQSHADRPPRVVFDLHHRHGGIRKDAVSGLLRLLETRYSLMERVYMHRTKLAASAMLGRAYLESGVTEPDLYDPHNLPSDDAFLRHLFVHGKPAARKLVGDILARRIYKPLFIIDEESCRRGAVPLDRQAIIAKYRPAQRAAWGRVRELEAKMAAALCPDDASAAEKCPFIVFCMGERVAYKDPRVIVEVPAIRDGFEPLQAVQQSELNEVPVIQGISQLMRDFTSDQGAQSQIASMIANYSTMWKFFVFCDMGLVSRPENVKRVPAVYAALVEDMGIAYPALGLWRELDAGGSRITMDQLKRALQPVISLGFPELSNEPALVGRDEPRVSKSAAPRRAAKVPSANDRGEKWKRFEPYLAGIEEEQRPEYAQVITPIVERAEALPAAARDRFFEGCDQRFRQLGTLAFFRREKPEFRKVFEEAMKDAEAK